MLIRSIVDTCAAPTFGVAVISQADPQRGIWTELGVVGILAMLLWQVTQYMLTQKKQPLLNADSHALHEKLLRDTSEDVAELLIMHRDPDSGFSTYHLSKRIEDLIEVQKDILTELRKHAP